MDIAKNMYFSHRQPVKNLLLNDETKANFQVVKRIKI